jgi:hypothetical protein
MKILFDAMGTQMQVQQTPPHDRLTTWFQSLADLGYECQPSDWQTPLEQQLEGIDVYVTLTRQRWSAGPIPKGTCFSYTQADLAALQRFVDGGKSALIFTNHSQSLGDGPLWPIFEIQLAAALGIQLVFASFAAARSVPLRPSGCPNALRTLTMAPSVAAPAALVKGVTSIEAWDSGGIVRSSGTPLIDLPPDCVDHSGLGYCPGACTFGSLYTLGSGKVIVLGHSGIVGDYGTCKPSPGQIESADNLTFLNNCITYLGGG